MQRRWKMNRQCWIENALRYKRIPHHTQNMKPESRDRVYLCPFKGYLYSNIAESLSSLPFYSVENGISCLSLKLNFLSWSVSNQKQVRLVFVKFVLQLCTSTIILNSLCPENIILNHFSLYIIYKNKQKLVKWYLQTALTKCHIYIYIYIYIKVMRSFLLQCRVYMRHNRLDEIMFTTP